MKKILLSSFVIISFILYALAQRSKGEDLISVPQGATSIVPNNPTGGVTSTPMMGGNPRMMGSQLKDGEYTGDVTDAYYGNVQVKAIISGGRITDVQFLDYPQDRRTSVEINTQAMPYLKTEAIQVQTSEIDTVSGATQTSMAFRLSLQSALAQAK